MTAALATGPAVGVGPARRAFDVVLAGLGLMVLAPVFASIALAVRLSSAGPVIFRQERVGSGARPFTLYKFRTMRTGELGPQVTTATDPRITRVGSCLRALSLDELPQLVNILRGDMTLVGPRPETPDLAARYPPRFGVVFQHTPGLTGPAQLRHRDAFSLPADTTDIEAHYLQVLVPLRVQLDLEYLDDPSLRRTLAVLIETIAHVLGIGPTR
jgi:lipopolysaccharide/colanic/teichoic acid biosynthesis glycosyltransferase